MDNLAHAMCAVAASAVLTPKAMKESPRRLFLASAVIANLPDIDFILNLFGQVTYHFHHRGFTHSIFGLSCVIPIAFFLAKVVFKLPLTNKKLLVWVFAQIVGSHFLLDYLTSYGVMFLYPLTMDRFAFPLMFIIDPILWTISILGAICIYNKRSCTVSLRKIGLSVMVLSSIWWLVLGTFKYRSESFAYAQEDTKIIRSFPGPFAPMLWLVLAERSDHSYDTKVVNYFKGAVNMKHHPIDPNKFTQDTICPQVNSPEGELAFSQYARWSSWSICESANQTNPPACTCHSLRYAFELNSGELYFGSAMIDQNGKIEFKQQDPRKIIEKVKRLVWTMSGH